MIKRIWHGWTTLANADRYERLLHEEIFEGIASKRSARFDGRSRHYERPAFIEYDSGP